MLENNYIPSIYVYKVYTNTTGVYARGAMCVM